MWGHQGLDWRVISVCGVWGERFLWSVEGAAETDRGCELRPADSGPERRGLRTWGEENRASAGTQV